MKWKPKVTDVILEKYAENIDGIYKQQESFKDNGNEMGTYD